MNDSEDLRLNDFEQRLLNDSFGSGHSARRTRGIMLSGVVAIAGLAVFPMFGFGFELLATFFILTVIVSVFEKLTYTRTMSKYDSLIRKLAHRIERFEGLPLTSRDGVSQLTVHGSQVNPTPSDAW